MIKLSDAHISAANKKRRVILQFDALGLEYFIGGMSTEDFVRYTFDAVDNVKNSIDSIYWDMMLAGDFSSVYNSDITPRKRIWGFDKWADNGTDIFATALKEGKKRVKENILVSRVSEVCREDDTVAIKARKEHPDWFIKCWTFRGTLNYANSAVREYKIRQHKEVMEKYDFDGLEIDFARHTPFLPPGKQWENRESITEYLRGLREMTLELEKKKGKPVLLGARIADCVFGCHMDGIDIEKIIEENLVDFIIAGDRSLSTDLEGYKDLIKDKPIKVYPCFDAHHESDGYSHADMKVYRGVFSSWIKQGADGIVLFNTYGCRDFVANEVLKAYDKNFSRKENSIMQIYEELADLAAMEGKDKTFIVERKGGYPWYDGYMNNNDYKPLPAPLSNSEAFSEFEIYAGDDLKHVKSAKLSVILYGMDPVDRLNVLLNGTPLIGGEYNFAYNDIQIWSPLEPLDSGFTIQAATERLDSERKLLRADFNIPLGVLKEGKNSVKVGMINNAAYEFCGHRVKTEKIELEIVKEKG